MDDLRFYVLFNSIAVISGTYNRLIMKGYVQGTPFTVKKVSPQAGLELGTARSAGQPLTH